MTRKEFIELTGEDPVDVLGPEFDNDEEIENHYSQ